MTASTNGHKERIRKGATKPTAPTVILDAIPLELRQRSQWVCWRWEQRGGEWTKPPINPRTGAKASSTNPETWGTFDAAVEGMRAGRGDGIGYVFSPDDPYSGIDLDDCVDPATGIIAEWANPYLVTFDSYTEFSPSGTGVKLIVRGKLPPGRNRKGNVEAYSQGRYFTITGVVLPDHGVIQDRQDELTELQRRLSDDGNAASEDEPTRNQDADASLSSNGKPDKFLMLFNGQWAQMGYESRSQADQALCNILADMLAAGPHPEQRMDAIMRRSGLYRAKWDRPDYSQKTITRALKGKVTTNPGQALEPIERLNAGDLIVRYPALNPPVIDGLVRERETANIISVSKIGKSWFMYNVALCIITGRMLFSRFSTSKGKVLLIDNELHRSTLAHRLRIVAEAMGIHTEEYADQLEILPLRGNLRDLHQLAPDVANIEPGRFKAIILDAKYRMIPLGASENDNAAETLFYNQLDRYAEQTGATWFGVHHSSKGNQGEKRVTDVGSGAGAQSRAADCHLILREHEEESIVVLEAAVRSFAPVEPLALRWEFPLWWPANDADPSKLKGKLFLNEQRQNAKDDEGISAILDALAKEQPQTPRQLISTTGLSRERLKRLLGLANRREKVSSSPASKRGNETEEWRLRPPKLTPDTARGCHDGDVGDSISHVTAHDARDVVDVPKGDIAHVDTPASSASVGEGEEHPPTCESDATRKATRARKKSAKTVVTRKMRTAVESQ